MAFKSIYLEPDEEITSVIDKINSSSDQQIALVLAKNSGLFQSLVNLKLLAKESKRLNKNVILITGSKIGQRLAGQVGIATYGALGAIPNIPAASLPTAPGGVAGTDEVINGVKVQQYDPNRQHQQAMAEDIALEAELAGDDAALPAVADNAAQLAEQPKTEFEPVTVKPEEITKPKEDVIPRPKGVDELPALVSRSGGFSPTKEFKIPWKSVGVGAGILLFVFLLVFIFVPRAVVTVTFPAQPLTETVSVAAVANLKTEQKNTVAGNELTVEKTKTEKITATGKKDVGAKATGTVTITNKHTNGSGVGKDQSFAAGTKVTDSKTKKVFTLNNAVTVGRVTYDPNNGQPIYKSQSVGVTALEPGEEYNIAATSFTIAGGLSDTPVTSSAAFSGGLTKEVTVLSQSDVDAAILKLRKAAKEEALKELTAKAANQKILPDGIWEDVKEEDTDKEVGAEVSTATATLIIEYGVVVFDEAAALAIFTAAFDGKITADEEIVFSEDNKPVFTAEKIDQVKKRLTFKISGTAFKVPKIDKTRIAKSITNKSSESAKSLVVQDYKAESVEVVISPSWWMDRLPLLSQEIRVEYGFNDQSADKQPDSGAAQ